MFDHAYGERSPQLDAQRAAVAERLSQGREAAAAATAEPPSPPTRGQRTSRR
jgi:hypothetical protein